MEDRKQQALRGVIPAICTPLNETGGVDHGLLEKQAAYLSQAGVNGFFIGGTTGEGAYLSTAEKREVFRTVKSIKAPDQILCAAYIQPSTASVCDEMKSLEDTEPDYVVAVTPYYLSMRQEDIIDHYRLIAHNTSVPLILYNIPGNTHNPISLGTISVLSEEDNIIGIKDSTGDFIQFSRGILENHAEGFCWIQGADLVDGPSLMLGCAGVVSGLSNARIEPYIEMYRAAQKGNWEAVRLCQQRIIQLHAIIDQCGNSIAAVKTASELAGRGSRWMRQKSQTLSDKQAAEIAVILEEFDKQPPFDN